MATGSSEAAQPLVTGTVELGPDAPQFTGATVRVKLRDVTMADAAARTIAEQVIDGVSHPATGRIPFELRGPATLDRGHAYLVEAHVDMNGSGEIESGDLITTASHPVPGGSAPARVDVQVHRIG
jgi:putative lipoprotein